MPAIVQAQANKLLDASLGTAALTAFSGAAKIRLTTTAPTATAAGTELTGTGYTAGGSTITFGSASAGSAANSGSAIQWTNNSGSSWSIVGAEIWDSAGTPAPLVVRQLQPASPSPSRTAPRSRSRPAQ